MSLELLINPFIKDTYWIMIVWKFSLDGIYVPGHLQNTMDLRNLYALFLLIKRSQLI